VSGVPCCVPAVTTDPSSWHNILPSRIRHGASDQTSKVQPQIYSWDLRKHKHIEVEYFILNMRYWDRIMFWRRLPRLGRLEYIMSIQACYNLYPQRITTIYTVEPKYWDLMNSQHIITMFLYNICNFITTCNRKPSELRCVGLLFATLCFISNTLVGSFSCNI